MQFEKTDIKVLIQMVKNVKKEYSIKQMADKLNRPYVKVHSSIQRLLKKRILKKKILGKSHYCRIDYKNNLDIVCFIESQRAREFLRRNKRIHILINNINEKLKIPNYSLIIFGSFAKNIQTKSSDLDLAIISSGENKNKIENTMNALTRTTNIKIHFLEFTYSDFIEMLKSKELTAGKEISENHIIIHGCEQFYESLRLAE